MSAAQAAEAELAEASVAKAAALRELRAMERRLSEAQTAFHAACERCSHAFGVVTALPSES